MKSRYYGFLRIALPVIGMVFLSVFSQSHAEQTVDLRGIAITVKDSVTNTEKEVKLYRQMHAVIIGIDKYPNLSSDQQLSYAVKDAKGIEKVLRDQYSFDNIYTLFNEQATRNEIMDVLQGKLANIHEDDAVFIFFAGHGATQKSRLAGGDLGYILPYDGTFENNRMHFNISMSQLRDEVAQIIPARHVFYVVDACYSGTLLTQRAGGTKPEHEFAYLREVVKEPVRQVLTAGTDKQTVLDGGPKGHSVFTGRLIEKLEETDDYITAAELGEYVKHRVASDAQTRGHVQTPRDGSFYGLGDFVFVPSANKRAQEIEKEAKRLEEELAKLKEQEQHIEAWKVKQQKEELESQQKSLETKRKIEEMRQSQIQDAKHREEERAKQEEAAKKETEKNKKQEEARLAHLRMEVEQKKMVLPDISVRQMSVEEAIDRIKKLQAELSEMEAKIEEAIKEAVKQIRADYEKQIRDVYAGPRDEFEKTAEYEERVAVAVEKKTLLRREQAKAEETVRERFSSQTEELQKSLDDLLNSEYPVSAQDITVEIGQYDADMEEMGVQIHWKSLNSDFAENRDKTKGYLKIAGKEAKLLKEHKDFLQSKGWVRIMPKTLNVTLVKIEINDVVENKTAGVHWYKIEQAKLPTVVQPKATEESLLEQLIGIWEGIGRQDNNTTWNIKMKIIKGTYSIDYPSLNCGGSLIILSQSNDKIEFREKLTYGKSKCVDNGKIVVTASGEDRIKYLWYYPTGKLGANSLLDKSK